MSSSSCKNKKAGRKANIRTPESVNLAVEPLPARKGGRKKTREKPVQMELFRTFRTCKTVHIWPMLIVSGREGRSTLSGGNEGNELMLTRCHNAYAPKGAKASYTYSIAIIVRALKQHIY
jgi:hypothetical protein